MSSADGKEFLLKSVSTGRVKSVAENLNVPTRETPFYCKLFELKIKTDVKRFLDKSPHFNYAYVSSGYINAYANLNKPINTTIETIDIIALCIRFDGQIVHLSAPPLV